MAVALLRRSDTIPIMRRLLGLGFCATMLLACGGRSVLFFDSSPDGTGGSGGSISSTTTTLSTTSSFSSSTTIGTGGAGPLECLGWAVALSEPIPITDPGVDTQLDSVVADGDRVLIATSNTETSSSPDPTWRVRVVAGDLSSLGTSHVVLHHPKSSPYGFSRMSLAARDGHRGGIAYNQLEGGGCRFVALAEDGAKAAPPVQIESHGCSWLDVSPSGYTALAHWAYSLNMVAIDPSGAVVSDNPIVTYDKTPGNPAAMNAIGVVKRLRLDDGTTVLAEYRYPPSADLTVALHHLDANGDALGQPVDIGTLTSYADFHIASMGTSLLTAWTPGSSPGEVRVRRMDVDGKALGPDNVVAPADGASVGAVSLVAIDGGALVAWAKSPLGAKLEVQALTDTGASMGTPFSVAAPPGLGFNHAGDDPVVMVRTVGGVLVAFEARDPATWKRQVFLTRLGCAE